ncbi:MAG: cell division protein SepF [Candidatus Obscuribacter sp.]|nr:cell division protein SepF [Candidatus Obscuribacter sp.]MBK7836277.1 cell division protein SepF [Candidatus Obscuribacter sp.]MBK9205944.1 cell division protein SepF [Candidatus Obscuribacter sp.]MBK9617874.1 cell division protein SepF [Candidatus Obscuribacter sp.]MBK9770098.1 cell division protein SepF [Candidatus Obscuribacter sp.]
MVDDYRESPQEKPKFANDGKSAKREIDLFPALQDRRMMALGSVRQAQPSRLGTQISIFSPVSFEEAIEIVECLRSRAATTISLENMKKLDASRLVDFVAGASAALDGDFHKLSEQVYVFCPANIKITAQSKTVVQAGTAYSDAFANSSESLSKLDNLGMGALDFLYPGRSQESANSSSWPTS